MTGTQHDRVEELFWALCGLSAEEQSARLSAESDAEVAGLVERMLASDRGEVSVSDEAFWSWLSAPAGEPVNAFSVLLGEVSDESEDGAAGAVAEGGAVGVGGGGVVARASGSRMASVVSAYETGVGGLGLLAGAESGEQEVWPVIEGYRIEGVLGRGGMGKVWRAVQLDTERVVAIKTLESGRLSMAAVARFQREIEFTAKLDHPYIARLYESRLHAGLACYVMEFVEGEDLDGYIRRAEAEGIDPASRLRLFSKICHAVDHAHLRGVMHRDLKPGNIMLTRLLEPKVLDFGLAKAVHTAQEGYAVTVAGAVIGTPAYMSPEQVGGQEEQLDTRSDVYSLGVILFKLLTGQMPYDTRGTVIELLGRIMLSRPPAPSSLRRGLDGDVDAIVAKALEKSVRLRYSTAGELGADIDRYLAGQPVLARPLTTRYLLGKQLRRHRGKVLAAGIVAGVLAAGAVTGGGLIYQANRATLQALNEANAARVDAEQSRRQLRHMSGETLLAVYDQLSQIGGTYEVRGQIAKQAAENLSALLVESEGDAGLSVELGRAYRRLAEVVLDQGDSAGAAVQLRQAMAMFEQAAALEPLSFEAQLQRMDVLLSLRSLLLTRGEQAESEQFGGVIAEGLEDLRAGALDAGRSALVDRRAARLAMLEQRLEEALLIRTRLSEQSPGDVRLRVELSEVLQRKSAALSVTDVEQSLAYARRAVEVLEAGGQEHLTNSELVFALAQAVRNLGDVQGNPYNHGRAGTSLEEYEAALVEFQRAYSLQEGLVRLEPANTKYRRHLAVICERLGDNYVGRERGAHRRENPQPELAWRYLDQMRRIFQELAMQDPSNERNVHNLVVAVRKGRFADIHFPHPPFVTPREQVVSELLDVLERAVWSGQLEVFGRQEVIGLARQQAWRGRLDVMATLQEHRVRLGRLTGQAEADLTGLLSVGVGLRGQALGHRWAGKNAEVGDVEEIRAGLWAVAASAELAAVWLGDRPEAKNVILEDWWDAVEGLNQAEQVALGLQDGAAAERLMAARRRLFGASVAAWRAGVVRPGCEALGQGLLMSVRWMKQDVEGLGGQALEVSERALGLMGQIGADQARMIEVRPYVYLGHLMSLVPDALDLALLLEGQGHAEAAAALRAGLTAYLSNLPQHGERLRGQYREEYNRSCEGLLAREDLPVEAGRYLLHTLGEPWRKQYAPLVEGRADGAGR